ncbi:hypothetical protein PMAYCL1PPCAC_03775, partial [Pristionchus mayeri]
NPRLIKRWAYTYLSLNLGSTIVIFSYSFGRYALKPDEYLLFLSLITFFTLPFLIGVFVSVHHERRPHQFLFALYATCQALLISITWLFQCGLVLFYEPSDSNEPETQYS